MNPREALIALNLLPDIGPVRVRNLLDKFGSATEILKAPEGALVTVDKVGPKAAATITNWNKAIDLEGEMTRIEKFGCAIVTQDD